MENVPTIEQQFAAANAAQSIASGVQFMNSLVTAPCPPIRFCGMEFSRHRWRDLTRALNTSTHTVLERCERCGLCRSWLDI